MPEQTDDESEEATNVENHVTGDVPPEDSSMEDVTTGGGSASVANGSPTLQEPFNYANEQQTKQHSLHMYLFTFQSDIPMEFVAKLTSVAIVTEVLDILM